MIIKKLLIVIMLIVMFMMLGCTVPNADTSQQNPPTEDMEDPEQPQEPGNQGGSTPGGGSGSADDSSPSTPPREATEKEKQIIYAIQTSLSLAHSKAQEYILEVLFSYLENTGILSSEPGSKWEIKVNENGNNATGVLTVKDRIDGQFAWDFTISSFELHGESASAEYKLTGSASGSGIGTTNDNSIPIEAEISANIENFRSHDNYALIVSGTTTQRQTIDSIYIGMETDNAIVDGNKYSYNLTWDIAYEYENEELVGYKRYIGIEELDGDRLNPTWVPLPPDDPTGGDSPSFVEVTSVEITQNGTIHEGDIFNPALFSITVQQANGACSILPGAEGLIYLKDSDSNILHEGAIVATNLNGKYAELPVTFS